MIHAVVVGGNLSQLLFTLGVHYDSIPLLERSLYSLRYIHRLHELTRGNIMLPIYNPEPAVFDFVLGSWPLVGLGHYAHCLPCRLVWHVQEVVQHLLHASFLVGANHLINWCEVKLVDGQLTLLVHLKDIANLAFHPELVIYL